MLSNRRLRPRPQSLLSTPGSRPYAIGHVRINNLESLIDNNRRENLERMRIPSYGGWIEYGAIVNGRRSGVRALINRQMLRTGSSASYNFPFFRRNTGIYIIRGHLLARVLGGSGRNPRNLVPLYHVRNNLPMYRDIERRIQRHVKQGNVVNFSARPLYNKPLNDPLSVLPTHIVIRAIDAATRRSILPGRAVTFRTGF